MITEREKQLIECFYILQVLVTESDPSLTKQIDMDNKSFTYIKSLLEQQGFIIEDKKIEIKNIKQDDRYDPVAQQMTPKEISIMGGGFSQTIKKNGEEINGDIKLLQASHEALIRRFKEIMENLQN